MHSKISVFVTSLLLFHIVTTSGCNDQASLNEALLTISKTGLSQDSWVVGGSISNADYAHGEVLGVGLDGARYRTAILDDRSFGIELPGNATYALYFMPPSYTNNNSFGDSLIVNAAIGSGLSKKTSAIFTFHEGNIGFRESLRLPYTATDQMIDLGEVEIKGDRAFSTINPATKLDFDFDGEVDFEDIDDQNDGQPDDKQKDEDERITICHVDPFGSSEQKSVSLSELFDHMNHQDIIGPCPNGAADSVANLNEEMDDLESDEPEAQEALLPTAD